MSNMAVVLKEEIARLAKKQVTATLLPSHKKKPSPAKKTTKKAAWGRRRQKTGK